MLRAQAKKRAIILSGVCLLCFLSKQVFDYVATKEAHSLIVFPHMLFSIIAVPTIYICGMIALLLFLMPLTKFSHAVIRKSSLTISFGFVFLYVVATIAFALAFSNYGYPIWCWTILQWLCKNPIIFSIIGVLIFLGLYVSNEE